MYLADDVEHKTSDAAKAPATPVTRGPKDLTKVSGSNTGIILIISSNINYHLWAYRHSLLQILI